MTTYAIDRRGFGGSGDRDGYTIEQEFRDVAVVVDAIAARAGPVALWGHSYGAGCAMGAAALTGNVSHLILYEPGWASPIRRVGLTRTSKALEAGDAEGVIRAVLVDILEMTAEDVEARRSTPQWAEYLRAAPTVLREARTENGWVYRPGALDGVRASTLVLVGTETAPALMQSTLRAAAAIPALAPTCSADTDTWPASPIRMWSRQSSRVRRLLSSPLTAAAPVFRGNGVPRFAIFRPDGLATAG